MGEGEMISESARYLAPSVQGGGDAWGAETAAAGRRGTQKIVRAGEVVAPDRVADLLAVERGGSSSGAGSCISTASPVS